MAGHCRDNPRFGIAGIICSWALQGYFANGLCSDRLPLSTAVRLRTVGEDNIDLNSNNPIARVWQRNPWGCVGVCGGVKSGGGGGGVCCENSESVRRKSLGIFWGGGAVAG